MVMCQRSRGTVPCDLPAWALLSEEPGHGAVQPCLCGQHSLLECSLVGQRQVLFLEPRLQLSPLPWVCPSLEWLCRIASNLITGLPLWHLNLHWDYTKTPAFLSFVSHLFLFRQTDCLPPPPPSPVFKSAHC